MDLVRRIEGDGRDGDVGGARRDVERKPGDVVDVDAGGVDAFLQFLLGEEGQKVMKANGFGSLAPAYASEAGKVPEELRLLVTPWP